MGIANLLKEGILTQDWDKINEAYTELTGETVTNITDEVDDEDGIEVPDLKDERDTGFSVPILGKRKPVNKQIIVDPMTGETKNYGVKSKVDVNKIKAVGNLFNPQEFDGVVETDASLGIKYPEKCMKGKRPKPKLTKTQCRGCKKMFEVAPFFVNKETGYICENCIRRNIGDKAR